MACGIPTIGSGWGGNTDFMDSSNSFLVGGKVVPIQDQQFLRLQPQYSGQRWFDIDEEQLSKTMRWVFDNREKALSVGQKGSSDVLRDWTWKHTAEKIHARMVEIENGVIKDKVVKEL